MFVTFCRKSYNEQYFPELRTKLLANSQGYGTVMSYYLLRSANYSVIFVKIKQLLS